VEDGRQGTDGAGTDTIGRLVAACRASHGRLVETVDRMDDAGTASLLPGWTVGHVLTHLARNADSHVGILEAVKAGRAVEQYPGGPGQRAGDIEAGAGREMSVIADDLRDSVERLEGCWAAMTTRDWDGHGLANGRPWSCAEMVPSRWAEVEIHHVDLGARYQAADWPDDFVALQLPLALARFSETLTDDGSRRQVLSWLLGRSDQPGPVTGKP
jgi:maleylpyruvate isomerase